MCFKKMLLNKIVFLLLLHVFYWLQMIIFIFLIMNVYLTFLFIAKFMFSDKRIQTTEKNN